MGSVLVVEDDVDIRDAIAELLGDHGYEVHEAENGLRALEVLGSLSERPCLILLDLMMPVMSGPEFLKRLEQTNQLAAVPVVVVSAYASTASVPQASRMIPKPPSLDLLLQTVGEFCRPGC